MSTAKKSSTVKMPKKEFIKEHKNLVRVLRSPSHADDKKEADKQEKELQEQTKKSTTDVSTRSPTSRKLAQKIIVHNRKKLHKSIDFKDTLLSIDAEDQLLAETTTNPALLDYIQKNAVDGAKIPFPTGTLTLSQREPGLFHGFFQDMSGQVIEKFDSQTVAIIAKTLQLKSIVPEPAVPAQIPVPSAPSSESMAMAAHDRIDMTQRQIDDLQRQVLDAVRGKSIKIKYGDFELEIKKSVQDFIGDFKAGRTPPEKDVVRKAITSWRKKHSEYMPLSSDQHAARELMENWDTHQDSFCQFVDALSRGEDEQH